jgi:hypothetical protein
MEISSELLTQFTRALSAQPGDELPQRLCCAFKDVVGADGAAIALGTAETERRLLAVTDRHTEQLEDLQDMVGEGPSIRALVGDGHAILNGGRDMEERWPMLMPALTRHTLSRGQPTLYAFPMRPQETVLGVLSAHQTQRSQLDVSLEEAQFLANAIGVAVLGDLAPGGATRERWLTRDRISQATGMVVAQLRIPPSDALAVLRAHAYAIDVTLSEVSRRVLDRSLRFTATNGEEES